MDTCGKDDKKTLLDICGKDDKEIYFYYYMFTYVGRRQTLCNQLYAITALCTNYFLITCNYITAKIIQALLKFVTILLNEVSVFHYESL